MTNPALAPDPRITSYLARLDSSLTGLTAEEKSDILLEIRTHISDTLAGQAGNAAAADLVFHALGSPEELGERYRTELMLARADRSFSPWLLLRTSWRWAKSGARGVITFLVALFGYSVAIAWTVSVVLKAFMPSRVGLWVGPGVVNFGVPGDTTHHHELLGQAYIPVVTLLAFATAVGTTALLRFLIRKRRLLHLR